MLLTLLCVKKQLALESPWDVAIKCNGHKFLHGKGTARLPSHHKEVTAEAFSGKTCDRWCWRAQMSPLGQQQPWPQPKWPCSGSPGRCSCHCSRCPPPALLFCIFPSSVWQTGKASPHTALEGEFTPSFRAPSSKTCVLLNDPDLGYSGVREITHIPCVNATPAITNAFEKEGCHQERFIHRDMFVLGTQMQQQNPESLCCPFPMAGAEQGPPGAHRCAGFPHQPWPCPSKPHVLTHWSSS